MKIHDAVFKLSGHQGGWSREGNKMRDEELRKHQDANLRMSCWCCYPCPQPGLRSLTGPPLFLQTLPPCHSHTPPKNCARPPCGWCMPFLTEASPWRAKDLAFQGLKPTKQIPADQSEGIPPCPSFQWLPTGLITTFKRGFSQSNKPEAEEEAVRSNPNKSKVSQLARKVMKRHTVWRGKLLSVWGPQCVDVTVGDQSPRGPANATPEKKVSYPLSWPPLKFILVKVRKLLKSTIKLTTVT